MLQQLRFHASIAVVDTDGPKTNLWINVIKWIWNGYEVHENYISIDTCTRHHNLFFLPTFFGAFFRIRAALVVMKFSNLHIKSSITLPIVLEFILFLPRNVNEDLYIMKYHFDLLYCVTLNENGAIPNKCYKSCITYQTQVRTLTRNEQNHNGDRDCETR